MDNKSSHALQQFKSNVALKFQLYNSLFTALPFHRIEKTGILLSLLQSLCEDGYKRNQSPAAIIEEFFSKHTSYSKEEEKLDLLFRFVQYAERQVVLFDSLEDAAFREVNDMNGSGTLKQLEAEVTVLHKEEELAALLKYFSVRLVLTAHPTQFYPGSVLGIINDLARAIGANNVNLINTYLQQLGKTAFFQQKKPTPFDEATSLIWYMENIFYQATGRILSYMKTNFPGALTMENPLIQMGFWPGGDRDGNPFVTVDTTLKVAEALRGSIIRCYYLDVRRIRRRLTFKGVDILLTELEKKLYNNIFIPGHRTELTQQEILTTLRQIKEIIIYQHNGLFLHLVNDFINRAEAFGLHFASLDIRQESSVHGTVLEEIAAVSASLPDNYAALSDDEKINCLLSVNQSVEAELLTADMSKDTIRTVQAVKDIQQYNGEKGCNRYIISQCNSALNAIEVFGLFLLGGWNREELTVDIVPLFETIEDLKNAAAVMEQLYENEIYKSHLKRRHYKQTIMVGFSDGTKDGGYLMANWSIYKAKEQLTQISKRHHIEVVFFDGRGGPPARGGGKTHKFYASMGRNISNKEIQLTIQGQTVSSNFGTADSAQYNIEQLLHAGISNELFSGHKITLQQHEASLMQQLAQVSFESYIDLKKHPDFMQYLQQVSPLKFYSETNIGSRPAKRGATSKLMLKDLRAIPFVGAWSQLKQNLTGFYGVGSALQKMEEAGKWKEMKALYDHSLFVKTLMDNSEMAMRKCFFPLTQHLAQHPLHGEIWNIIFNEYELTKKYLLQLSGRSELMSNYPVEQLSIQMRERIVLPLLTIQQFAISRINEMEEKLIAGPVKETCEKLVIRCSFGIINAGRNSA
ncbi:MAG: phosphoenolpyruvate carboxylase [Ferruginibacter sp.]